MSDIEDEVFESVSVLANKMPRGIFRNPNHDQINGLPEENEEFWTEIGLHRLPSH